MAREVSGLLEVLDREQIVVDDLDAGAGVADMDMPGFRFHALKGELKGFWAVTVRANWRVIFQFADHDAFDVNYSDYH